ncbi:Ribokinase like superfamily protein, putative [Babesia bigemina]|uniref:Ribokinase like superfamily protein, putative n=1 Tax=Babesia bigemina TaxID=5866 RepID=A0A061CZ46_BABBI|nr:Ribokinase like superfamily protein, putative [Babesia bigemina]CDR93718.1 Ribokinase like superfamily protein, putative [Babesia bigemina]|eukprot:XP_012765904.1 Ribokinase like superfamily protein, putative [Babesia bigemina]
MNASYIFAAFVGIFASVAYGSKCQLGSGDEVLEKGPSRLLIVGNPIIDMTASVDYSVVEALNLIKGESKGLVTPDDFKRLGDSITVQARTAGGSSGNVARAYGYLGGKVAFLGRCGQDEFADQFSQSLAENGVEDLTIRIPEKFTTQLYSLVTPDAERTMYVLSGASRTLQSSDVDESLMDEFDYYVADAFVYFGDERVALTNKMVDAALSRGKGVITLFSNMTCIRRSGDALKELADKSTYISGNLEEYSTLYGIPNREDLFRMFEDRTSGSHPQHKAVIITMGGMGAMVIYQGKRYIVPPCKVDVVDTSGAGDFFAGSFLYGVLNGWNVRKAGKFAVAMVGDILSHMGISISEGTHTKINEIKGIA